VFPLEFIHGRLLGAARGLLTGGGIGGAVGGFITGGGGGGRTPVPGRTRFEADPIYRTSLPRPQRPVLQPIPITSGCPAGFRRNSAGNCVAETAGTVAAVQRFLPGGESGLSAVGEPAVVTMTRRVCLRGSVLGLDGLCHPKGTISNRDRWWPKPRRPLLTGGDLNAIAKAARAARRLQTTQKRLQKLGMLPKPSRGGARGRARGHQHVVAAPAQTLRVISEETN